MAGLHELHWDWLDGLATLVGAQTAPLGPRAKRETPPADADKSGTPTSGPRQLWELQAIVVEPGSVSIAVRQNQQYEAFGIYGGGHSQVETDALEWKASPPDLAWFDESKKGLLIAGETPGEVHVTARDSNSGKVGHATLTIESTSSQMSPEDALRGDVYRLGHSDGQHEDDEGRAQVETMQEPDLLKSYDRGFQDGEDDLDEKWNSLGVEVDKSEAPKRPDDPALVTASRLLDGAGMAGGVISILEAGGAPAFSEGVVGTSIGAFLLPIFAGKLGFDIGMERQRHEEAVDEFVNRFVAITVVDALHRAGELVDADARQSTFPEFNAMGIAQATKTYKSIRYELSGIVEDYVDDEKRQDAFIALHDEWVKKMSKQWATFMSNPRFHQSP